MKKQDSVNNIGYRPIFTIYATIYHSGGNGAFFLGGGKTLNDPTKHYASIPEL